MLGGTATNITLDIDASKWFVAADGSRLDPRDAANKAAIEANIRASFNAFEDDDENGEDDRGEHRDAGDDHGDHDGGDDHGDGGHGGDGGPGHH